MANLHAVSEYPPDAQNGGCVFCRAPRRDNEPVVIDTGVYVDFPEKRLCICSECVRWMAHLLGFPTQEDVIAAFETRDAAIGKVAALQKRIDYHDSLEAEVQARIKTLDEVIGRIIGAKKKAERV